MIAVMLGARVVGRGARGARIGASSVARTLATATDTATGATGGASAGATPTPPAAGATTGAGATGDAAGAAPPPPLSPEAQELARLRVRNLELENERLRLLAEMENTRRIAAKDVDIARKFGIQKFAKDMLNVSDDISRALASVPAGSHLTSELPPFVKVRCGGAGGGAAKADKIQCITRCPAAACPPPPPPRSCSSCLRASR